MRRLIATLLIAFGSVIGTASEAFGDTGGSAVTDLTGVHSDATAAGNVPGQSPARGGVGQPACEYRLVPIAEGSLVYDEDTGQRIQTDGTGQWYEKWCDGTNFLGAFYIVARDPAELVEEARRYLELPLPEPTLSPAGDQIVNLPTWLWLASGWTTAQSSVSVPGATVTVTAEPIAATWSMGDGSQIVCNGPGVAYDASRPASDQTTSCAHTFTKSSASQPGQMYRMSVTVTWRATWAAAGFTGGGDLGTIDRTTTFTARAAELQAVNTRAT